MSSNSSELLEAAANARTTSKDGIDTWKLTYKYKGYTVSWMQSPENLEALQNFEVREDDIYCVTYPKAGKKFITSKICKINISRSSVRGPYLLLH